MNEARANLLEAAERNPEAWADWTKLIPGLYAYDPETCEVDWITALSEEDATILSLKG